MKKFTLLLISMAVGQILMAGEVSKENAAIVGTNFYHERIDQYQDIKSSQLIISESFTIQKNDTDLYHVFNFEGAGYVIVSATDAIKPIIGYSFKGHYAEKDQPENFKGWMGHFEEQLAYAIINGVEGDRETQESWDYYSSKDFDSNTLDRDLRDVEPLILSGWNQGYPYNIYCPSPCPVGCVAVAMGQLMYYWRWPHTGVGSYSYKPPLYDSLSADFGSTTYRWEEMVNDAGPANPSMAELLFHIGVSVDMNYTPNGSGMWNHKAAYSMRTYFKYAPETEYLYRDSTNLDWDSCVVAHLDQGIPCYYAGWSDYVYVGGHAWVCDGYQGEFFHMNWGWGRSFDGYFLLDDLTPGGSFFNYVQELVINAYPDTINYQYPSYCSGDSILTNNEGSFDDGSGPLKNYLDNANCSWLISPQSIEDSITDITLNFSRLNTDINDMVTVYDGASTSDPILGTYSGAEIPSELTVDGNEVLLTFSSDDQTTGPGWYLNYTSTSPDWCNGLTIIDDQQGVISDGSGDFYYQNDVLCRWVIRPDDAYSIYLTFNQFNIQEEADFLEVYNFDGGELLGKFSGNEIPESIFCPSGEMMLLFNTDESITFDGWEVEYITNVTGVSDIGNFENIRIYPNPSNELLWIEIDAMDHKEATLSLTTLAGQRVVSENLVIASGKNSKKIDVSSLPAGIYILRIQTEDNLYLRKAVIQ